MHRTRLALPIQMLWKEIVARRRTLLAVVRHPGWTVHRHNMLNRRNWMRASLIQAKVALDVVCRAHKPLPHQMVRCVTVVTTIGGIHLTNWHESITNFNLFVISKKQAHTHVTLSNLFPRFYFVNFDFLNVKFLSRSDFVHFYFFTRDVCMFCHFWPLRHPLEQKNERNEQKLNSFCFFFNFFLIGYKSNR